MSRLEATEWKVVESEAASRREHVASHGVISKKSLHDARVNLLRAPERTRYLGGNPRRSACKPCKRVERLEMAAEAAQKSHSDELGGRRIRSVFRLKRLGSRVIRAEVEPPEEPPSGRGGSRGTLCLPEKRLERELLGVRPQHLVGHTRSDGGLGEQQALELVLETAIDHSTDVRGQRRLRLFAGLDRLIYCVVHHVVNDEAATSPIDQDDRTGRIDDRDRVHGKEIGCVVIVDVEDGVTSEYVVGVQLKRRERAGPFEAQHPLHDASPVIEELRGARLVGEGTPRSAQSKIRAKHRRQIAEYRVETARAIEARRASNRSS